MQPASSSSATVAPNAANLVFRLDTATILTAAPRGRHGLGACDIARPDAPGVDSLRMTHAPLAAVYSRHAYRSQPGAYRGSAGSALQPAPGGGGALSRHAGSGPARRPRLGPHVGFSRLWPPAGHLERQVPR